MATIAKTFYAGPLKYWLLFMVIPNFVRPVLATPVCAFIHDAFMGLANSIHVTSSLMVLTSSTSTSARHLCSRRILALLLLHASLSSRLLCEFLDIDIRDFNIVDLGYLKHNFLDHDYSHSLLATSTLAQMATSLLEHFSHTVCPTLVATT
jgi:hypothetical protein